MSTGVVMEEPLASTFDLGTGERVTVVIVGQPTPGGLCRCQVAEDPQRGCTELKGSTIVRHRDKLTPLNAAARQLLGKS